MPQVSYIHALLESYANVQVLGLRQHYSIVFLIGYGLFQALLFL